MKKLIFVLCLILVVSLCLFCLSGCDDDKIGYNKQIFDFNQKYTNAYLKVGDEWTDVKIKSWNDYEGEQIQIILEDNTVILTNSVNCILYSGNLPNKKYYINSAK